jgi:hypothetical protein
MNRDGPYTGPGADDFEAERYAWNKIVDARDEHIERLRDALRYIAGWDVAGYEAHLNPQAVATGALVIDASYENRDRP